MVGGILEVINDEGPGLPCRLYGPALWFADEPADLDRAKLLCAGCPVRVGCLVGAMRRREPCGVWGGEIFENGAIVPFKRPRGRPRRGGRPAAA